MSVKYQTEKPTKGRFYFFPNATTEVTPDGEQIFIDGMPMSEKEGCEFFYGIGEYIPKEDCVNGIYIEESEYDRCTAEAEEEEYRRKYGIGRISAFLGIILCMYPEDGSEYNRPHLHAFYGEDECEISIPDGEVLSGSLPARQLRNVQTFIDMREAELKLNWELCMKGQNVIWVDPIR